MLAATLQTCVLKNQQQKKEDISSFDPFKWLFLVTLNVSLMRPSNSEFGPTALPVRPNYTAHKAAPVLNPWKGATLPWAPPNEWRCVAWHEPPRHSWSQQTSPWSCSFQAETERPGELKWVKEKQMWFSCWRSLKEADQHRGGYLCPGLTSGVALTRHPAVTTHANDANLSLSPSLLIVSLSDNEAALFFVTYASLQPISPTWPQLPG